MTKGERVGMATKYLLVASTEACSGKSATILGIADRLHEKGIKIAYTQPVVTGNINVGGASLQEYLKSTDPATIASDAQLMATALSLPLDRLGLPLLVLDAATTTDRLTGTDRQDYTQLLQANVQLPGDLVILEGGANLYEGSLFDLATAQIARSLDAGVLLVNPYDPISSADVLLSAQQQLGDKLLGCVINDIPRDRIELVQTTLVPYLEQAGIPVIAIVHRQCDGEAISRATRCRSTL
jgi:BioD-like phosphotransacetylase family protein